MLTKQSIWEIQHPNKQLVEAFMEEFNLTSISAKILATRGCETIEDARKMLYADISVVHDPFLMYGMDRAVARIRLAIERKEKILVYHDYDCDGVSGGSVVITALEELGADVTYIAPNRFKHGYGPHADLFREAHANGIQLIITVDNGISGIEPIRIAKELGMDVIVTDHHEAGEELPIADVILHPRVPEGHYPFGELAGVGVAFKLAHALLGRFPTELLEYVVIGTIADIVPLVNENRYFVREGLKLLRYSNSLWVKEACRVSGITQSTINEDSIGFYIGPRFNAVGRLGDAMPVVEFLTSRDPEVVTGLADTLNDANNERKKLVEVIMNESIEMIENNPKIANSDVLIVAKEGWNAGVVGIVASRLVERYYKPTIVLGINPELGLVKGSARSIEGYHLYNSLAEARDLVPHFGGHPMAAGMTFPVENVDALRERLDGIAKRDLTPEQLIPKIKIDMSLSLEEITVKAIEDMKMLSPFGEAFARPVFAIEEARIVDKRKMGSEGTHLKVTIEDMYNKIDCVGFGKGEMFDDIVIKSMMAMVGDLQVNEWQGNKKPQFMLKELREADEKIVDVRFLTNLYDINRVIPDYSNVEFVAFRKDTADMQSARVPFPITHVKLGNDLPKTFWDNLKPNIVLLDFPTRIESLRDVFAKKSFKKIYIFGHGVKRYRLDTFPGRDIFGWYYKHIQSLEHGLDIMNVKEMESIAYRNNISFRVLMSMTLIFTDIGLFESNNGIIRAAVNPEKKELSSSTYYKDLLVQINTEQRLLENPVDDLKEWFRVRM
ncbi:hypothetical protein ABD91_21540 [Lysinibacillus sphaericus]|nr:hypothetical protein [Lysinibacillus sphaericus]